MTAALLRRMLETAGVHCDHPHVKQFLDSHQSDEGHSCIEDKLFWLIEHLESEIPQLRVYYEDPVVVVAALEATNLLEPHVLAWISKTITGPYAHDMIGSALYNWVLSAWPDAADDTSAALAS